MSAYKRSGTPTNSEEVISFRNIQSDSENARNRHFFNKIIDTVRLWLGQKTLAVAIHYTETADTSDRMREVIGKLDPLGSKSRTSV
jgi:hypothetical protein